MEPESGSFLDNLEALQDEVLDKLDELNQRLEATLAQFRGVRGPSPDETVE